MSKADRIKRMRSKSTGDDTPEKYEGVRPIRMRGYYRAVKRGDAWAVKIANLIISNPMSGLLVLMYRNVDFKKLVYSENPFLKLIPKDDSWLGTYIIPMLGDDD